MSSQPKQLVLIDAYEELTEKESFCLKESNIEGCLRIQEKKAKLLLELEALKGESLAGEHGTDYRSRVANLQVIEKANGESLSRLIEDNREEYRKLSKQSGSASKFRKAYANVSEKRSTSVSLEGQA